MTLILRIENFDQLETGGPTWLQLDGHGASIGRRGSMDWTLPDPSKMISGHHFDVTFRDGIYLLTDVSTNGTFVDGQGHRIQGELALRGGERLIVGHYIIAVDLPSAQPQVAAGGPDEWDVFPGPSEPVAPPPSRPMSPGGSLDDLGGGFVPLPGGPRGLQTGPGAQPGLKTENSLQIPMYTQGGMPGVQTPGMQTPGVQVPAGPPQTPPQTPAQTDAVPPAAPGGLPIPPAPPPIPAAPEPALTPAYVPTLGQDTPPEPAPVAEIPSAPPASPPQDEFDSPAPRSLGEPTPAAPMPRPTSAPIPSPVPSPVSTPGPLPEAASQIAAAAPATPGAQGGGQGGDVTAALRAFCEGAGLDPNALKPEDAIGLMHMLGRCSRIATEEIMLMLKARADVKNFTRGGVRTMLSANANNPMKFMPDSQQALELMFVAPRDGFMMGADSFDDALKDIRLHQEAVFRALQPALAEVFGGLSPEEIEAACDGTGSNLFGGGGGAAKLWQAYVERWDSKAQAGEHGILDAFLQAFARAYAEANVHRE